MLQATHASVLLSREMERAEWRCALPARSAAVGALVRLGTAMPCVASGNEKKFFFKYWDFSAQWQDAGQQYKTQKQSRQDAKGNVGLQLQNRPQQ